MPPLVKSLFDWNVGGREKKFTLGILARLPDSAVEPGGPFVALMAGCVGAPRQDEAFALQYPDDTVL